MRLVKDARNAWRWLSVRALAVLFALPLVWPQIPADVRAMLPPEWQPWVLSAIALGGIAGRLVDQGARDA